MVKFLWSLRSPFAIPLNKIPERRWFSRLFRGFKKIIGLWKIKKSRFRFLSVFVVCHFFVFLAVAENFRLHFSVLFCLSLVLFFCQVAKNFRLRFFFVLGLALLSVC